MKYIDISKKILNIMFYSLFILVILLFTVFNYKFYNVLTGSMSPTIKPGSLIIVKPEKVEKLKVGDVITFKNQNSSNITTHRIKSIQNESNLQFITQGDANNIEDPMPISENLIIGKVIMFIPFIGATMAFIKDNIWIMMLFVSTYVVIALWPKKNKEINQNN